ncbi:rho guanine nucleotide exchange factor 15 isoform X2 [Trichomycterus rosablanca]|uniref:rho guanine nucleotide exchange factor 15 isoform X2 n=1 Tax=Trichomycterus rosablanca TaxID=2290929 RepID=UPI002F35A7BE
MSSPYSVLPPPKPELKQKPQIASKPINCISDSLTLDKNTDKNSGKVLQIVSKFNKPEAPAPLSPTDATGHGKKAKTAPTVKPKLKVSSPPQSRADQAPPLPVKQRQSQRTAAAKAQEDGSTHDLVDGRRSAPDGKEVEQKSVRLSSFLEPQCEKNCNCVCHLQRPGMKLVWVQISETEQDGKRDTYTEEEENSEAEEVTDSYQSEGSESEDTVNVASLSNKERFKATLNIIEGQLRRKSDPGPESVINCLKSLPQFSPHLTKTHSVSEEESIYEATIDLIVPSSNFSTTRSIQSKYPPAIPPRMPLEKNKERTTPRRGPLPSSFLQPVSLKLPSADESPLPVRPPPLPPPTRANAKRLSNVSQASKEDEGSSGNVETKDQRKSAGLTRQKSLDLEANMPEGLLYQIYTETYISKEIRRQTVCRNISKTSADYPMDHPRVTAGTSSGPGGPTSSPIFTMKQATLWQDLPAVRESGILNTLTADERKYQESMYEVLTSEVSYLRSLRVLTEHFMESQELNDTLIIRDKKTLFSNILRIREVSERFLKDLEERLDQGLLLTNICDIISYHAQHNFPAYIDYVRNQIYQDKTFTTLMQTNSQFATVIAYLQDSPICQRLPFSSFLLLPFQRITRIKILIENILKRTEEKTSDEELTIKALTSVSKIIDECNVQVGKMKQMEELIEITKTLEFDKLKAVPIISQNRFLEKRGELQEVVKGATLFHLKPRFTPVFLFLFNDLLVLASKKGCMLWEKRQ